MRKTYKSSNVRFCMENENQRRTWEYLQGLTRKESSYGKALSDAFVTVLDGKNKQGIPDEISISESEPVKDWETIAERLEKKIADRLEEMQKAMTEELEECFRKYAFPAVSEEEVSGKEINEDETAQVPKTDMSEAMMSMALAMGE